MGGMNVNFLKCLLNVSFVCSRIRQCYPRPFCRFRNNDHYCKAVKSQIRWYLSPEEICATCGRANKCRMRLKKSNNLVCAWWLELSAIITVRPLRYKPDATLQREARSLELDCPFQNWRRRQDGGLLQFRA